MSYHVVSYQSFSFGTFSLHIIISKWNPKSYSFEIIFIHLIIKSILFHHTIIYIIYIYISCIHIILCTHNIYIYKMQCPVEAYGGTVSTLTRKLASLGSHGKFPNNLERDLFRALELPIAPFYVDLPVRCQSNWEDIVLKRMPLLLPHQLYHYLFDTCFIEQIFVSFGSHSVFFWESISLAIYIHP